MKQIVIKNYHSSNVAGESIEIPSANNIEIIQHPDNGWYYSVKGDLSKLTEEELNTNVKLLGSPVMTLREFLIKEQLL